MLTCEHGVRPKKNCKECNNKIHRSYYRKKTEESKRRYIAVGKKRYYDMLQSDPVKMRFQSMMIGLRRRRKCDVNVNALLDLWSEQNAKCTYCGKEMTYERGGRKPTSVSVDRIDASVHYTKTNIVLARWACNAGKGVMTTEEYIQHCRQVVLHSE